MILKDIYFFEETNQIGDSKILINENKGDMLSLQVNCEGNFNFEVQGCIDILSDTYNKVFATNMLTSERQENITSNGIYQIDIDGYRKIKLVLNSIGSQPITVYGVMKEENGDIDIEDDIATKDYVNAAISGKEDASNKVTSIDNDSTDVQYPSAKAVYDLYQNAGQTLLIGDILNLTTSSTTQQIYDAFGSEEIFNSFLDYTKNSKPIYMHSSYEYVFDGRYTDTIPIIKTLYDKYPGQNNGQVSIIFPNMSTDTKEMFTYYHMVIGFSSNVPSIVSIEKLNSLEAYIINPAIDSLASESTSSDISNVINLGEILKLTSGSDINGDYILNMYSPVFKFSDNTYNPAVLYNIIGISVDNFAYMSGGYNFIIQYMKGSDKLVTLTLYSNSRGETDSYAFVSKTEITLGGDTTYIYTGTNTADDIEAFESIIDEYNQTGKWDLDYIIYKNTTVMRDVQIRMNEATLLSATSYVKSYRFIFKGDYQAANTQYNTTLYGKATVVWLNGDYSINFEVETVDNIAPLDNNLQYDRKVLTTDNTTSFTPTNDYHPATKKYVDDIVGDINTVLSSLVTVGGGN